MSTEKVPSTEDLANLIRQWEADPCWDLEDTPGFEIYRDHLVAIVAKRRKQWAAELERKAEELGVPGNTTLAGHFKDLEARIAYLEEKVLLFTKERTLNRAVAQFRTGVAADLEKIRRG